MTPTNSDPNDGRSVRHNAEAHRYEMDLGGQLAVAEYTVEKGRWIFTHTFVPPEFRGQGIAEKLVRHALDGAREQNVRVIAACSYVAAYIHRHREYQALVSEV